MPPTLLNLHAFSKCTYRRVALFTFAMVVAGNSYVGTHTRHLSPPPSGCELYKGVAFASLLGDHIYTPLQGFRHSARSHQIFTTHLGKKAPAARCHSGRVRGTVRANCRQVATPSRQTRQVSRAWHSMARSLAR